MIRVFDPIGAAHQEAQAQGVDERLARKLAAAMGSWKCPGKCGRWISANKELCRECSDKAEDAKTVATLLAAIK